MARRLSNAGIVAIVAVAAWFAIGGDARARLRHARMGQPGTELLCDAGRPRGPDRRTLPRPRPTPPLIGQVYITYEPLAPQEFLYLHHQRYVTCNGSGTVTRTSVTYGHHLSLHPSLTNSEPGLHTPPNGCSR